MMQPRPPQIGDKKKSPLQADVGQLALAVDGGGTKTAFLLFDCDRGTTLATAECPGINKFPRDEQHTNGIIQQGLQQLRKHHQFRAVAHSWLALAGPDWCPESISNAHPELGCLRVVADITAVLGLIDRTKPGVVIHAGTGSFATAWTDSRTACYCGGAGWIIGDPGSGVDLGRRALFALRSNPTTALQPLTRAIQDTLSQPLVEIIDGLYRSQTPAAVLASIAPAVVASAHSGDPLCLTIIRQSVDQLLQQATSLSTTLGIPDHSPLFLSGRILNLDPVCRIAIDLIATRQHHGNVIPLVTPPVEGVRSLMFDTLNRQLPPPDLKRFNRS